MSEQPQESIQAQLSNRQEFVQRICAEDRALVDRHFITAGMLHNVMHGGTAEVRTSTQWILQHAGINARAVDFSDDGHLEQRVDDNIETGTKHLKRAQRKEAWAEKIYDVDAALEFATILSKDPTLVGVDYPNSVTFVKQAKKIGFDINPDKGLVDRIIALEDVTEYETTIIDGFEMELATLKAAIENGSPLNDIDVTYAVKEFKFGRQTDITPSGLVAIQKELIQQKLAPARERRDNKDTMISLLTELSLHTAKPAKTILDTLNIVSPTAPSELSERHIAELNLGVRAYNCLARSGVYTVGELVNKSEGELYAIPNFGKKCMDDILEGLASYGLSLRED